MPTRLEDMERLSSQGRALEGDLQRMFLAARESVTQQRIPKPPPSEPIVTPASPQAACDAAPPPHYGFYQDRAPAAAPRLEQEIVTPDEARARLSEYVRHLRSFSRSMLAVSKLSNAIADLIEYGTVRRGPKQHVQRR